MKTPDHYTSAKTPIERLPEAYKEGFIIGNIIKYASRAGLKDSFEQDLEKCLHYCQMLMELRAGKVSNDQLSDRIKQIAELLQNPEPTTTILRDQPEPAYNQIVGRGTRVVAHPKPKGEVPPLPEEAHIPYGCYQLGLDDVLDRETDRFWGSNRTWKLVDTTHGSRVSELPRPIAYRIYK